MKSLLTTSAFALLSIFVVSDASADSSGATGRITDVEIVAQGSDLYNFYRGSVTVRSGNKKGTSSVYKWGGSTCTGKNLTDAQVQILMDGLSRGRLVVEPRYKPGQGGNRCLTGFKLRRLTKKDKLNLPDDPS